MSSIFLFKIINAVIPDPKVFLSIAASVTHTAAVNPNGIRTVLNSGLRITSY